MTDPAPVDQTEREQAARRVMDQDPVEFLGEHGVMRFFDNSRGYRLASYFWPATTEKVRGIVHLLHGHGGYTVFEFGKHKAPGFPHVYAGSWIEALNNHGYSVAGLDNQGCGRSAGLRCYIDRLDDYVQDIVALANWSVTWGIAGFSAQVPRFLLGESLGGCVAVLCALGRPDLFAGVVLLAPMLSLERVARKGLNPYLRPFANLISWAAPTWQVAATNKNEVFPNLQKAYDLDPMTYKGKTRARNACEYLQATERLSRNLEAITFPFIVFHSDGDTQVDVAGSKRLYAEAKSEAKTLRLLTNFWHMLVKEPGNEAIRDEVIEWLNSRTA